jgi:hypothetical protein
VKVFEDQSKQLDCPNVKCIQDRLQRPATRDEDQLDGYA